MRPLAIAAAIIASLGLMPAAATAAQPRNCDDNAIVYCGGYTLPEIQSKLASGDSRHSAADIQQILYQGKWGVTSAGLSAAVDGVVYRDGRVVVNGQTVATNAVSAGRINHAGATKEGSVYVRPNTTAFASNMIEAYVNMDGGQFHWALLKSCGNPVRATPVAMPTPAPVQPVATPHPTPVPPVPTPVPTPAPQPKLPATGPVLPLGGAVGFGVLSLTARSYVRSRRSLVSARRHPATVDKSGRPTNL